MGVNIFGVTSTQEIEMDRLRALNSLSSAADIVGLRLTVPPTTVNEFETTVSLSPPAEMFRELSLLQSNNQDGFRTLVGQVAEQLSLAAAREGGDGGLLLNQLAARFSTAASTGALAGLAPTPEELGLPSAPALPVAVLPTQTSRFAIAPPVDDTPAGLTAAALPSAASDAQPSRLLREAAAEDDAPLELRDRPTTESTLPASTSDSTNPGMARAVEVYRSTLPPAMPPDGLQNALNGIYGLVQQQFSLRLRAPSL